MDTSNDNTNSPSGERIRLSNIQRRIDGHDDIEDVVTILRYATLHLDQPAPFTQLGRALYRRFVRTWNLDDIDDTVWALRYALDLIPDQHSEQPSHLDIVASTLRLRFERVGKINDIEEAISLQRLAVRLTPDGRDDKPSRLSNLGGALSRYFERLDNLAALEEAISVQRQAVELAPDGHADKPALLNNLGGSLFRRFERLGKLPDLEAAIAAQRHAVEITPEGHYGMIARFNNLGGSLRVRFEWLGEPADLEEAISVQRRAVELMSDEHLDKPGALQNLGFSLFRRFEQLQDLGDLEEAVSVQRRAVHLTPEGHPSKAAGVNNLGISLYGRFQRLGNLADLEEAISVQRNAVKLAPDGHPDKPMWFNHLALSLHARFGRLGELTDLEEVISLRRRIIELTPERHPNKLAWVNNLGLSLHTRFVRLGVLADLEEAISIQRNLLEATSSGDPNKPARFNALAGSIQTRFERLGNPVDLEESVALQRRAVELAPDDPSRLYDLGYSLYRSFERFGKPSDLEEAIIILRRAAERTPEGHPTKPARFNNLGISLARRFELLGEPVDFDAAISCYTTATEQPLGNPSLRLMAARNWITMLTANPAHTSRESLLNACARVFNVLPEIVWLGYDVRRRYDESSQLAELVNTAVALTIAAGALTQAVEWLEAGRALVWAQALSLRTPLDDLRKAHPKQAKLLYDIQQTLQLSSYASLQKVEIAGESTNIATRSALERHRGLVIEYDNLTKEIRTYPGFEDFLRPKPFAVLAAPRESANGPVVFINVGDISCDALVLSTSGEVTSVPLPLTLKRAKGLHVRWLDHLKGRMVSKRGLVSPEEYGAEENPFYVLLECMWIWVAEPVLTALDLLHPPGQGEQLPCITWCPTGPLTQLPLHAAGVYSDSEGPRMYNLVVSSYTPSLSALLRSYEGTMKPPPSPGALVLTQPDTPGLHAPLPGTRAEGRGLRDFLLKSKVKTELLEHEQATGSTVRAVMNQYPWIHLACHGLQDSDDATQSAFYLYDGKLSLLDLMGTSSDDAELAFLSACQTATGDEKNPEESVHLAAGMLAVGYKGVVATMWAIGDADAPIVVEAYYKKLLELRSSGTLGTGQTGAAYALHEAVKVLREKVGEQKFVKWAPFVHFGV